MGLIFLLVMHGLVAGASNVGTLMQAAAFVIADSSTWEPLGVAAAGRREGAVIQQPRRFRDGDGSALAWIVTPFSSVPTSSGSCLVCRYVTCSWLTCRQSERLLQLLRSRWLR